MHELTLIWRFKNGVTHLLFAAAYVAEDVRGGLQSIPPTQAEAAAALGLNASLTMRLIILPQALTFRS